MRPRDPEPWDSIAEAALASADYMNAAEYGMKLLVLGRLGLNRTGVADVLAAGPDGGLTATINYYDGLDDEQTYVLDIAVTGVLEDAIYEAASTAWWAVGSVGVGQQALSPAAIVTHALTLAVAKWMRQVRVYLDVPDPETFYDGKEVPDEGC